MQNLWMLDDKTLPDRLKKEVIPGPMLARPDLSRRFCINTERYKVITVFMLLQSDYMLEAINSDSQKKDGVKC